MARDDAKKRSEMMAREWWKSKSTMQPINKFVTLGVLDNQELGGWRTPMGESFLDPRPGEIVVFEDFF